MRLLFFLGSAGMLAAQAVSIGVKGGVRLTDDFGRTFGTAESKQYVVGPMLTARLPLGFRLEFDALYRRVGFRNFLTTDIGGSFAERDTGNSWGVPDCWCAERSGTASTPESGTRRGSLAG